MPALTLHRLKSILLKSYELGYFGCLNVKDSVIDSLLEDLIATPNTTPFTENDGWKIFSFKELLGLKNGTILEHSVRGKGIFFLGYSIKESYVAFNGHGNAYLRNPSEEPWNQPMRIISIRGKK